MSRGVRDVPGVNKGNAEATSELDLEYVLALEYLTDLAKGGPGGQLACPAAGGEPPARTRSSLLDGCRVGVARQGPSLMSVEVGTPLLLHEGMRAVEWLRGELAGRHGRRRRQDLRRRRAHRPGCLSGQCRGVTVVGAAADMTTWEGVLEAASTSPVAERDDRHHRLGAGGGRHRTAVVLRRRREDGVTVEVCVHRRRAPRRPSPPARAAAAGGAPVPGYLVAGR